MSEIRPKDQWLMSYKDLRKGVGLIGIALPFILILGKMLIEQRVDISSSISIYYFTVMSSVFVGCMCAIGVFLIFYRGPEWVDNFTGHIAGVSAIGVALLPTTPYPDIDIPKYQDFDPWVGNLHIGCAAVFFAALAYFCLVLFVKTKPHSEPTPQKIARNRIYRISGYVILVFLILESVAVFAFGVSWLVKGEAILKDQ